MLSINILSIFCPHQHAQTPYSYAVYLISPSVPTLKLVKATCAGLVTINNWLFKVEYQHSLNIFPTSTFSPHRSHAGAVVITDQFFYDVDQHSPHCLTFSNFCSRLYGQKVDTRIKCWFLRGIIEGKMLIYWQFVGFIWRTNWEIVGVGYMWGYCWVYVG